MARTLTIDLKTGDWSPSDVTITGAEGAIVASSVLPGTTPELVNGWYGTWMSNDKPFDPIAPLNTVGELITALQAFPEQTPIASGYDGSGRITMVPSYVDDQLDCVALF